MHFRRNTALAVGAVLLSVPTLASCGFDYATDQVSTIGAGANNRDASVDVLNAIIVSAQKDSGTFIASLSNNDQEATATFESLAGAGGNTIQPGSFAPVTIQPGGFVNLATDGGVPVSGSFEAGNFVPVTLTFGNGERVSLKVPVVVDGGDYAGLDTSSSASDAPSASPSE